jgi:flavin-binding protein dodecin
MLKMLEVTESSPEGYSEAVKKAVQKVIDAGQKVHFFQVMEQRGSVRDGQINEFQVIVKIAVE